MRLNDIAIKNMIMNNDAKGDFELIKKNKNNEYSYECIKTNFIPDKTKIQLTLKNNGKNAWPRGTKLIYDKGSFIIGDEIILEPQNPGEARRYNIIMKNLGKYRAGEYYSYLLFYVNGHNFGEKITLKIVIKKDEYLEKVKDFRNNFGVDENDYPDEKLLETLKKYNFNEEKAFDSFFE